MARLALHHYTAPYAAAAIRNEGVIKPAEQPLMGFARCVWLTDYRITKPESPGSWRRLNLHPEQVWGRVTVHIDPDKPDPFMRWTNVAHRFPDACRHYRSVKDAEPWRWWITPVPIYLKGTQ